MSDESLKKAQTFSFIGAAQKTSNQTERKVFNAFPQIDKKQRSAMLKLMIARDCAVLGQENLIKTVVLPPADDSLLVSEEFLINILPAFLVHLITLNHQTVKLINVFPRDAYNGMEVNQKTHFQVLRQIRGIEKKECNLLINDLQKNIKNVTLFSLQPVIWYVFRQICPLYYMGTDKFELVFKQIFEGVGNYCSITVNEVQKLIEEILVEWNYIVKKVIPGLYPVLMRACSAECVDEKDFFNLKKDDILNYVHLNQQDIIVYTEEKTQKISAVQKVVQAQELNVKKREPVLQIKGLEGFEMDSPNFADIPDEVKNGLFILDKLFPDAGWLELENQPDMYPYFQVLYKLPENFALISPDNPMQVVVILICILDNLFLGCRNVRVPEQEYKIDSVPYKVSNLINDWYQYCDVLYEREYAYYLGLYTEYADTHIEDFRTSTHGRSKLASLFWRAKTYFLPFFKFGLSYFDNDIKPHKLPPFTQVIDILCSDFESLCKKINEAKTDEQKQKLAFTYLRVFDKYNYMVPNVVSSRLDEVLGGKQSLEKTNAHLFKVTVSILHVLQWWVSDKRSFAYQNNGEYPCRMSVNFQPVYDVEKRTDLKEVFEESIKKLREVK